MTLMKAAKLVGGLIIAGLVLLLASIFVADNQLNPPFDESVLGPIELPVAPPISEDVLMYNSNRSGNHEIYVVVPGGAEMALTNDVRFDSWRARLSPDRTRVLFYRTPAGVRDSDPSQAGLWMVGVDGSGLVEVLPPGAHGWLTQGDATWSPAGDELVMTGSRSGGSQIWVTSLDGRSVRSVVAGPGDNSDPSWSPDAKRILFVACPEVQCKPSEREIYTVVAAGGERIRMTSDVLEDATPQFSPDGQQIAIATETSDSIWDIRVLPTNLSQPPRALMTAGVSRSPHWSDSRTIIFDSADPDNGSRNIYEVEAVTGSLTVILGSPADEAYPTRH